MSKYHVISGTLQCGELNKANRQIPLTISCSSILAQSSNFSSLSFFARSVSLEKKMSVSKTAKTTPPSPYSYIAEGHYNLDLKIDWDDR